MANLKGSGRPGPVRPWSNGAGTWDSLKRVVRKLRRAILRDEPTYYDMYLNPGERFFARLYLHRIEEVLRAEKLGPPLKILDAGCQTGRLAVPLAMAGHQVTGVDTSDLALRRARRHSKEAGTSLRLIRANLSRWLPLQADNSFDLVVCTEVLYLRENYRFLLEGLLRILRPGGLGFVSHRPTAYYLIEALQRNDGEAVQRLLTAKEGILWGSYYNWQEREELETLYHQLGVEVLSITPIGLISWLAVKPDDLDSAGQDFLLDLELKVSPNYPKIGRYLLVSGRKQWCQAPLLKT